MKKRDGRINMRWGLVSRDGGRKRERAKGKDERKMKGKKKG